jgi:hypothetical protein
MMIATLSSRHIVLRSRTASSNHARRSLGAISRTLPKLNDFHEIPPDSASVSTEIKVKNAALAVSLMGFCVGVAWYSTYAVGQAGGGAEDPLAALRNEAAAAQQKHEREERKASDAEDVLKQFHAGGYDPDLLEDQAEETITKKKRPWYKFW